MARAGLSGVIEIHPNRMTPRFEGRPLNLSAMGRAVGASPSHISNILRGRSSPSLSLAKSMALSLDMDITVFLAALDTHIYKLRAAA